MTELSNERRDEWMRRHKGELLRTEGIVWWCGDDYCDCSQAQIVEIYRNLIVPGAIVPVVTWQGPFYTDSELGADTDLLAKREEMKAADPEAEARIEWQLGD